MQSPAPIVCSPAPTTTDLLRRADAATLAFFDAVDRFGALFNYSTGLVAAAFQVRVLDLFAAAAAQTTERSARATRAAARRDGLPVVGGGR